MIIPLGPGSLRDSSSLPEGRSGAVLQARHIRAGPALPSYLALLHAGFSVPRMSPPGRWALTPPFHPCPMTWTERGGPLVLPQACRRGPCVTGGLFSVALSVAALARPLSQDAPYDPLALPGALPITLRKPQWGFRRVVPRIATSGIEGFSESGLSSRPLLLREANRRSSGSPAKSNYIP
jgi:hypothetical protein